jgi:hypothetical protein
MRPASLETVLDLSPMQHGVLFDVLFAPESTVYVNQSVLTVDGALDPDAMARAWDRVMDRHQVLRCSFFWERIERAVQAVHRRVPLRLVRHDWRTLEATEQNRALDRLLAEDRAQRFDLRRPPLMRIALVRVADERHLLVWTRHHILFDGWSQALLLGEVFRLYEAFRIRPDGVFDDDEIVGPRIPFERYIGWLQTGAPADPEGFWRTYLRGVRPVSVLDRHRDPQAKGPVREVARELPLHVQRPLERRAQSAESTTASIYQIAWALVLASFSGADDVVFGSTMSGRPATIPGIERMVGLFINSLPVRVRVDPGSSIAALARSLQRHHAAIVAHQHTPLVQVRQWAEWPPMTPLFESVVVIGNYPVEGPSDDRESSLRVTAASSHVENSLPVTLRIMPGAATRFGVLYDESRLEPARAGAMLNQLELVLTSFAANLDVPAAAALAELRAHGETAAQASLEANARRLGALRRRAIES